MALPIDNTRTFIGQGVVHIGEKDPVTGDHLGLEFVGNASDLMIKPTTQQVEHKESMTGKNSVDQIVEKGTKVEVSFKTCSTYKTNIRRLLFADVIETLGGSVSDEQIVARLGKASFLRNINLTNFASLTDATATTTYVENTDYRIDLPTGRIDFLAGASFAEGADLRCNYTP